jgi:nitroreductase
MVHELIRQRRSPRVFQDRAVPREILVSLFEAARWAASSFNEQPWRFLVTTREDPEEHARLLDCLSPKNQEWARYAPVLMLSVASTRFARNDRPNRHAFHDVGLAVSQLTLQATSLGLAVHQMAGFDADRSRAAYAIPEGFDPVAAIALGYPAEEPPKDRSRRPLEDLVFRGTWGGRF